MFFSMFVVTAIGYVAGFIRFIIKNPACIQYLLLKVADLRITHYKRAINS